MWSTLGDVLTAGGDFFGAEDAFRQASEHSGYEQRAAAGLARVYGKLGRYAEAFAQLARSAELAARP
jgi:Flp pilus assembly protein TadD